MNQAEHDNHIQSILNDDSLDQATKLRLMDEVHGRFTGVAPSGSTAHDYSNVSMNNGTVLDGQKLIDDHCANGSDLTADDLAKQATGDLGEGVQSVDFSGDADAIARMAGKG